MNDTTWLFVYGTLRPGYGNYEWMKEDVVRVIRGVQAPGQLFYVGRYGFEQSGYPVARFNHDGGVIHGDLLEVKNGSLLQATHGMEIGAGYTPVVLQFDIDGEEIEAIAYDWQKEGAGAEIPSGDYRIASPPRMEVEA